MHTLFKQRRDSDLGFVTNSNGDLICAIARGDQPQPDSGFTREANGDLVLSGEPTIGFFIDDGTNILPRTF